MTERERQIYEKISDEPSISQGELAKALGIARSSVAVHISNLQKKGYILGKGYIVRRGDYVVGVGAANIDLHAKSREAVVLRDSNPSIMRISAGGVSRNVCENLARLGADARLITAVGDEPLGSRIRADSELAGVDMSNIYTVEGGMSSTYISILDETGDMAAAFSDMRVLEQLPEWFLRQKTPLINGARLVTCDPSLPRARMEQLLDIAKVPVYLDPVSTSYARCVKDIIGRFDTVKPNLLEAEILSGMKITSQDDLAKACEILIGRGVRRVFVSLGADGCFYMDADKKQIRRRLKPPEKIANATGGGDAFMAGVIFMSLRGASAEDTVEFALAAGTAAVMSPDTINPDISEKYVNKILTEYKL